MVLLGQLEVRLFQAIKNRTSPTGFLEKNSHHGRYAYLFGPESEGKQ
jgi:hypothetical protein